MKWRPEGAGTLAKLSEREAAINLGSMIPPFTERSSPPKLGNDVRIYATSYQASEPSLFRAEHEVLAFVRDEYAFNNVALPRLSTHEKNPRKQGARENESDTISVVCVRQRTPCATVCS